MKTQKPLFNLEEYVVKNRRGIKVGFIEINGGGKDLVAKEKRHEEEQKRQEAETTTG